MSVFEVWFEEVKALNFPFKPDSSHTEMMKRSFEAGRDSMRQEAYLQARGHQDGNGFKKYGNKQLYWKGRSDAATEIRKLPL